MLRAYSKVIAHNGFRSPRIRVLDWNIGEIKDIVIKTRKTLTVAQNFHLNRNVDRLYMQKSFGEIGLRQVQSL